MAAGLDRAGIGRRPRARCLVAGLLVGAVVGVGGCTAGGQGPASSPSPTAEIPVGTPSPSPTSPGPVDPLPTPDGVVAPELPELPLEAWRFTADELGADAALVDPIFALSAPNCCGPLATVIDAGDALVVGWRPGFLPAGADRAELVGLSPGTGELLWRLGSPETRPISCAERLLDGDLACLVRDDRRARSVVLLDPATGDELDRFEQLTGLDAVDGSDLFSVVSGNWSGDRDQGVEVQVARYTRSGAQVWSTTFDYPLDDILFADDARTRVAVAGRLVVVEIQGALRVLDRQTGQLVLDRGTLQAWWAAPFVAADDHVVLGLREPPEPEGPEGPEEPEGFRVLVLRADGTVAHTLPGMRLLTPAVRGAGSSVLVQDAGGQIHTLDVTSGATAPTGITPAPDPEGAWVRNASLVGDNLVASVWIASVSGSEPDELRVYDLGDPAAGTSWSSVWELRGSQYADAFTDGERLFGLVPQADGFDDLLTAVDLSTGEVAWQLERPLGAVTVAGGRLLAVEGDAITLLAPDTSPFGNLEAATAVAGGIEVAGWAIDPDTTDPIYVWVTVDGVGRHLHANADRPDVADVYPAFGPGHGFRGVVPAGGGTHRVCVTASNVGPGDHELLGCRTVRVP